MRKFLPFVGIRLGLPSNPGWRYGAILAILLLGILLQMKNQRAIEAMDLSENRNGSILILGASGRIDHQSADAFQQALDPHLANCNEGGDKLVLDFSKVDYVSSVGLRVLLMASKKSKAQKGQICIAAMLPTVGEVFRISRFDTILPAYDTVDAAAAAFSD